MMKPLHRAVAKDRFNFRIGVSKPWSRQGQVEFRGQVRQGQILPHISMNFVTQ